MSHNLFLGKIGEQIACRYLSKKGFQIIEKNFHKHWGEIDIIAIDNSCLKKADKILVFIEVKTRFEGDRISAEQSISSKKISLLKKGALFYKNLHPNLPDALRIDFVGVTLNRQYQLKNINHFENITS